MDNGNGNDYTNAWVMAMAIVTVICLVKAMGNTIVMRMTVAIALVILLTKAMQTEVATFLPGYGNDIGYGNCNRRGNGKW